MHGISNDSALEKCFLELKKQLANGFLPICEY